MVEASELDEHLQAAEESLVHFRKFFTEGSASRKLPKA